MAWRTLAAAAMAGCLAIATSGSAADNDAAPSIQYVPLDAPAGMSQAVVVRGYPLVFTRQLLPLDRAGKLVGEDSVDKQIEQVLDNLQAVLGDAGSGLDKLVRLNVYALSPATVTRVRELLHKRLAADVRPALTAVLTSLPDRHALLAVDAVAVAAPSASAAKADTASPGAAVALKRCEAVAGDKQSADAAVMARGGVAYLSGQPDHGELAVSAVGKSLATLMRTLGHLKLGPAEVVQVKVFLSPAAAADEVRSEIQRLFPGPLMPPVVFVEWIASVPVEIELIAHLPVSGQPAESVEFYNPPEFRPSPTFSRVALVRTDRQVFTSSLTSRVAGTGEAQARDVFEQLKAVLDKTESDMRHLAKATYYVSDDEAGKALDKLRPQVFDSQRPPAASKITVFGVGQAERTLSVDLIAVGPRP